jgi:pimeloyl-ACP methyl ester carboxylesterase
LQSPARLTALASIPLLLGALSACGGNADAAPPTRDELASACPGLGSADVVLPVPKASITTATLVAAAGTTPEHCQLDGEINRRTGIDGKPYVIKFRLRMPTAGWNGRFFMGGGGGTNGTLVDPVARVAEGYATIGTDSGHDNVVNNVPEAGGTAAFGLDPQARADFGYNAYDQVTQAGKALVTRYYRRPADRSYFMGCSEGGREALLMTQRFPNHYDGVVAGDPVLHLPLGPLSGLYTTQLFAGLANRSHLKLASGPPALGKTYSDSDLLLMRDAVLSACDSLDGLADGIVDNLPACTKPLVNAKLAAIQCTGAKTDSCLSADQVATMQKAFDGTLNSSGKQLYSDWQWDAGIGGKNGTAFNPSWRSWWLGSFASATNNATKLNFATAEAVAYNTPPQVVSTADSLAYALGYDFDTGPAMLFATSGPFTQTAAQLYFTDSVDVDAFRSRGGKMMVYHGGSDSSVSVNDTLKWYQAMSANMGAATPNFARMFVVPGMAHCSGGPATDSFDMLPQLVNWVENGVAPDSVTAKAINPGYFGVAARSRPLCPFPKQSRYKGSGDINDAANFSCQ